MDGRQEAVITAMSRLLMFEGRACNPPLNCKTDHVTPALDILVTEWLHYW